MYTLCRSKGFTLIELLIVVAIIGLLATVAIISVSKFIGSGTIEAADSEAHMVQTAVAAYMANNSLLDFDGDVGPETTSGPEVYITGIIKLQAVYTFSDGVIHSAVPLESGKWKSLEYVTDLGWQKKTSP